MLNPRIYTEPQDELIRRIKRSSMGKLEMEPSQALCFLNENKKQVKQSKVIKEIMNLQNSTNLLISKAPFEKIVKEISQEINPEIRFQKSAVEALHEAAEAYTIGVIEDGNLCSIHAKRKTLMKKDVNLATTIRGE